MLELFAQVLHLGNLEIAWADWLGDALAYLLEIAVHEWYWVTRLLSKQTLNEVDDDVAIFLVY